MVRFHNELLPQQIMPPIMQRFHNGQHLTVGCRIITLSRRQFPAKISNWPEPLFPLPFLKEACTDSACAGVGVNFQAHRGPPVEDGEHWRRRHRTLQRVKRNLVQISPYPRRTLARQVMQRSSDFRKIGDKTPEELYKTQKSHQLLLRCWHRPIST